MTEENPARDAAYLLIARGQADDLEAYLGRGRQFEADTTERLTDLVVLALEQWVADVSNYTKRTVVSDIFAEFAMREVEPSHERVGPLIDRLGAKIEAAIADVPDDRREQAGEEMMQEYRDIVRRRN